MKAISAYTENEVATQAPGRVVVLLYEGAIRFLKQAIGEIQAGRLVPKGQFIAKAIAIIDELNAALDMEAGGEVAQNLRGLYLFMNRHLAQANTRNDIQMLREVISLLEDLNGGWKAIVG